MILTHFRSSNGLIDATLSSLTWLWPDLEMIDNFDTSFDTSAAVVNGRWCQVSIVYEKCSQNCGLWNINKTLILTCFAKSVSFRPVWPTVFPVLTVMPQWWLWVPYLLHFDNQVRIDVLINTDFRHFFDEFHEILINTVLSGVTG